MADISKLEQQADLLMQNVSGGKNMTIKKAIQMIDKYLLEPNSIHKDWVEALRLCRKALIEIQEKGDGE